MSDKVYSIDEIKTILYNASKNRPIKRIVLFGSYAKNSASPTSDIDIIIDTDGVLRGLCFVAFVDILREMFNKEVDGFEKYEII